MKKTIKEYTPAKVGEKWITLAMSKSEARPDFNKMHGNLCADGVRLHVDNSMPACACEFCNTRVAQLLEHARRKQNTTFTITTAALVTACKQAIAIGKDTSRPQYDFIPTLRLSVNGSLKYSATCEDNGSVDGEWITSTWETSRKTSFPVVSSYKTAPKGGVTINTVKVEYAHEGRDVEFGVNPKHLADALSGMGESVEIRTDASNAPLYITDGKCEAVLMPIHIR